MMIQGYSPEIESQILTFYNSLSEKDRRRYAAIDAIKPGYAVSVTVDDQLLEKHDFRRRQAFRSRQATRAFHIETNN